MYTVSTTLVSVGPLWGAGETDGEAARGDPFSAPGFAVGEIAGFPEEASSRAATRALDAITTTASTK
jgi:hypothetical protein